jgi:peptide/nickel transport system substrate-binding protein
VLAFISTLPVNYVGYRWEPRLITHLPDFENGDVITRSIALQNGAEYLDSNGLIHTHYGTESLSLAQMVITYTLKSGIKWSDGHSLTTDDILFSYKLVQNIRSNGIWQSIAERTAELIVLDENSIRWEGLPGYVSTDYPGFLFPPQPEHVWQDLNTLEILQDQNPPVLGPYRITTWEEETLFLEANPYYIGDKPEIERINFIFPNIKSVFWPEMLRVGTCDILFPGSENNQRLSTWLRLVNEGIAEILYTQTPTLLRLDFNVKSPNRRSAPLQATQTRFGLAHCVSRGHLRERHSGAFTEPAYSFVPEMHPAYDSSTIWRVPFNIEVGQGILEEIGWRDENKDGIRESHDIEGIRDNTPLTLTLSTSTNLLDAAQVVAADLKTCGVGVIIDAQGPELLFASSSASPLYAGDFQLALYYWNSTIPQGCTSWSSSHFPDSGLIAREHNYTGYSNPLYDEACQKAKDAVILDQQVMALRQAQRIISEEQPTLFLTWQSKWFISNPDIKNLTLDITALGRIIKPEYITRE